MNVMTAIFNLFPAVASRMNYSVDHVIKMHGDALAAFEIVLKDNGK